MRKRLLLFLLFSPTIIMGCIEEEYGLEKESVASLSEKLSGKWLIENDQKKGKLAVMELSFTREGNGECQFYDDYVTNNNVLFSCQPIPQLKKSNEEFYIHYVEMAGEHEDNIVYFSDGMLILTNESGKVMRYKRLDE